MRNLFFASALVLASGLSAAAGGMSEPMEAPVIAMDDTAIDADTGSVGSVSGDATVIATFLLLLLGPFVAN